MAALVLAVVVAFIIDANGHVWAKNMKRVGGRFWAVAQSEDKRLSDGSCRNLHKRYRGILTPGEKEFPAIPE